MLQHIHICYLQKTTGKGIGPTRYQFLLIDVYLEYRGDTWVGYDRRFCLTAAAKASKVWAHIDPTLWNLTFTGIAKTSR